MGWKVNGKLVTGNTPERKNGTNDADSGVWRNPGVRYTIGALPRPEPATGWNSLGDAQ